MIQGHFQFCDYFVLALPYCLHQQYFGTNNMEEEVQSGSDNLVTEYSNYEEFLSSQINSLDLFYLEV